MLPTAGFQQSLNKYSSKPHFPLIRSSAGRHSYIDTNLVGLPTVVKLCATFKKAFSPHLLRLQSGFRLELAPLRRENILSLSHSVSLSHSLSLGRSLPLSRSLFDGKHIASFLQEKEKKKKKETECDTRSILN